MVNEKEKWKKRFIVVIFMYCWFILWVIITEHDFESIVGWVTFLIMCLHFTYVALEWRQRIIEKLRELGIDFQEDT